MVAPAEPGLAGSAAVAVAVGALATIAYLLLPRAEPHQFDVYWMVPKLLAGDLDYPRHPLALHLADLVGRWTPGPTLHARLQAGCAFAAGLGVAIATFAAIVWCAARTRGALAGLLFACLPATVHHATVFELHALSLPFLVAVVAGVVLWARWPTAGLGAVVSLLGLSVLAAAATSAHATGHVHVLWLGAFVALEARARGVGWMALFGVALLSAIIYLSGVFLIAWSVLPAGAAAPLRAQAEFVGGYVATWSGWLDVLVWEWLVPFAPVSVAVLWAAPGRAAWRFAGPMLLALAPLLFVCQRMLVLPEVGYVLGETGAYQLPIGLGACLLVASCIRTGWWPLFLGIAVAFSAWDRARPDKPPPDRAFGAMAWQFADRLGDGHCTWLGDYDDYGGVFELGCASLEQSRQLPRFFCARTGVLWARHRPGMSAFEFGQLMHPATTGGTVHVLTEEALARLRGEGGIFRELVDELLPQVFRLEPVELGTVGPRVVRGVKLVPK